MSRKKVEVRVERYDSLRGKVQTESSIQLQVGERFRICTEGSDPSDFAEILIVGHNHFRLRFGERTVRLEPAGGDNVIDVIGKGYGD